MADKSESKSQAPAEKPRKVSGPVNHAVHVGPEGDYIQGPEPKRPAAGSKSVVVMTPTSVEEYPDGTHPPAPAEEQYWSAARVEKYNQLSGDEKNGPVEDLDL